MVFDRTNENYSGGGLNVFFFQFVPRSDLGKNDPV